jgi:hypothetical protein
MPVKRLGGVLAALTMLAGVLSASSTAQAASYCTGFVNFKPPAIAPTTLWFSNAICVQNDGSGSYRGYWNVAPRAAGGNATIAGCYYVKLSKLYSTGYSPVASSARYCSPVSTASGGLYIFTPWTARAPGTFCAQVYNQTSSTVWSSMYDSAGNLICHCQSF